MALESGDAKDDGENENPDGGLGIVIVPGCVTAENSHGHK